MPFSFPGSGWWSKHFCCNSKNLGWVQTRTKYYQLIKEPNRVKQLQFCLKCQEERETVNDIICTDKCSVHMKNHARICFCHKWEQAKFKGHSKHTKCTFWPGFSSMVQWRSSCLLATWMLNSTSKKFLNKLLFHSSRRKVQQNQLVGDPSKKPRHQSHWHVVTQTEAFSMNDLEAQVQRQTNWRNYKILEREADSEKVMQVHQPPAERYLNNHWAGQLCLKA